MRTNREGIELIKLSEGLKLQAYKCPAGVWTIGYGHTGDDVVQGLKITAQDAEMLLLRDIATFELQVLPYITSKLNDNQFSALVSFTYNVGIGNFRKSTLLKKVNANPNDHTIRDEFLRWNKANGIVLEGLSKRRVKESNLYYKQ